jgi:hypothetical protein
LAIRRSGGSSGMRRTGVEEERRWRFGDEEE